MKSSNLKEAPFYLSDEDVMWVNDTYNSLSKEEKAGQLFCTIVRSGEEGEIREQKSLFQPGGMMYRPLALKQAIEYSNNLKKHFKIPMLIPANLEKGGEGIVYEGTHFASQLAVAATKKSENAQRLGEVCGVQAKAVGGNWAFAPVIDIDFNWRNPITNVRTYGADPQIVAEMGEAYVKSIQKNGVAAAIKHFPGDGVDERDQHLALSINDFSVEEWDKTYGMVYKRCIDADALTVMIGHIAQPAYSKLLRPGIKDEEIMPASLAPELMQDLLREKLGFNGLVVTDASTMNGFVSLMPRSKAVPKCIEAGADMLLFCKNTEEDFQFMMEGIESGILSQQRLEEAVKRVLALKAALGLHKERSNYTEGNARKTINNNLFREWKEEVADQAVTLVKSEEGVLPLDISKKRILFYPIEPDGESAFGGRLNACDFFKQLLEAEGFEVTTFVPENLLEGNTKKESDYIDTYDYIIYLATLSTKSNQTVVRIEWKQPMGADCPAYLTSIPTIFISAENPYHLVDVPRAKTYINAYDSDDSMLKAIIEKLMGRSEFKGESPVDPFCGKWDTHL